MKYVFLTQDFYNDFSACGEIEQKPNRPYACVFANIDGLDFAIPLRSNITHKYCTYTNKALGRGLDYSKAVIVSDKARYVDNSRSPHIRQEEFDALRGKEHLVELKMRQYIRQYKRALNAPHAEHTSDLLQYSTLQYFHVELGIDQ